MQNDKKLMWFGVDKTTLINTKDDRGNIRGTQVSFKNDAGIKYVKFFTSRNFYVDKTNLEDFRRIVKFLEDEEA